MGSGGGEVLLFFLVWIFIVDGVFNLGSINECRGMVVLIGVGGFVFMLVFLVLD